MNTSVVGVESVFGWVAGVSAKAVILILIVFVLQKALRGRISARLGYCLWLIVIARMLLPYSVPSVASVFNLVPQVNNIYQPQRTGVFAPAGVSGRGTVDDVPLPATTDSVQNGVVSGRTAQSPDVSNNPDARPVDDWAESTGWYGGLSGRGLVLIVWLAGVIAMGGYILVSQIRLWRVIRKQPSLVDQRILSLFEDVRRKMKVHIPVALVRADCVDSPVLFGFIRPRLLLPDNCIETFDDVQLGHVFSHELAHVRRNDIFVAWVALCLQVLHWFNPLVWLAFARLRYYRELACDEQVLSGMGKTQAIQYARTLVRMAEVFTGRRRITVVAGIFEDAKELIRRVNMIAKFERLPVGWSVLAVVVIFVFAASALTDAQEAAKPQPVAVGLKVAGSNASKPAQGAALAGGTIQKLIDAAADGTTVVIPAGKYSEPVKITKAIQLVGSSTKDCVLEVTANEPAIFVDTKGKGKVIIEKMTIKWQLATSDKNIEYPMAVVLKDSDAEVKNCIFRPLGNTQRSPIAISSSGFTKMVIANCDFEGFEYVVNYGQGTSGSIRDCFIRKCGHQGIMLYAGAKVEIIRNIVTGSAFHGVRSTGGNITMKDNIIIGNKNRGVYLGNKSASGVISNNLIIDNATGIDGMSASRVKIHNNVIAKSSYSAIAGAASAELAIENNILFDNACGIRVHKRQEQPANSVPKFAISKNTFWKNQEDTIDCQKSGDSLAMEVKFKDADADDFSVEDPALKGQGLTDPAVIKQLLIKLKAYDQ